MNNERVENLSEFLNEFGIFFEIDHENILYLKYRLFPTPELRSRLGFDGILSEELMEDTFFAYFDEFQRKFRFSRHASYRERKISNGVEELIQQHSRNMSRLSGCHIVDADRKGCLSNKEFRPFIHFKFSRIFSPIYKNIYLDRLTIPQIELPYEIVSIKMEVSDIHRISSDLVCLFQMAHNFTLSDTLGKNYFKQLIEDPDSPIFPMHSKFIYFLQMSEYYQSYFTFSQCDPVAEIVETRVDLMTKKLNTSARGYDKLWIWLMSYQTFHFQVRMEHFLNKKDRAEAARQIVEGVRTEIFEDDSIVLFEDEDDGLF